ncbi:MAG: hypothetical protein ACI9I0_001387 [Rhodoferax sp.]|jgi:hypothetical protein
MRKHTFRWVAVLVIAAVGAGIYYGWPFSTPIQNAITDEVLQPLVPLGAASTTVPPAQPSFVLVPPAAPISAPLTPVIQFPMAAASTSLVTAATDLPPLAESDPYVRSALDDLLGPSTLLTFLQLDVFVLRVVATVDNLARTHAPLTMWPVNPSPGRFTTLVDSSRAETISPDNGQRYTPLVLLIESINTPQAIAMYARLYPLFQNAYEELGFPGRYFNDRLVAVIDHLLNTPVQTAPVGVGLVEVKGPIESLRPWVRYEFTDPVLESLSSGQKMLVRSGPVNHRRLNAKLREIRTLIAGVALPRP